MPRIIIPIDDRLFKRINKIGKCWEWIGYRQKSGYGIIGIGSRKDKSRRSELVHRISWKIHNGPIPKGMFVLHKCDNPPCVNPDHLFIGNQLENMRDCWKKGRGYIPSLKGEEAPWSKLKATDVIKIRKNYSKKRGQISEFSKEYGVSVGTISLIVNNLIWKHLS